MPSTILTLFHTAQAAFAGYNLYLASISIRDLQTYEDTAKKAAEYSNIAASQLHKTQTTQASGTIAVLISFLSSAYFATFGGGGRAMGLVAGVNLIILGVVRKHVGEFWRRKFKLPIPGMGNQNEAIGKTQEVRLNMMYLMGSWGIAAILGLFNL